MTELRNTHSFSLFCERMIRSRLPGVQAQKKMAPLPDYRPAVQDITQPDSKNSAVMIICALSNPATLLYTLRTPGLAHHGGQISFPGGQQEPGESLLDTAMRETSEEVGVAPGQYEIAGCLSPLFVPVSGFIIHPWLAFCDSRPEIRVRTGEVSEAFWVRLDDLLDEQKIKIRDRKLRNDSWKVPYWDIHSVPLWGATAMITSEMVTLYRDFLSNDQNENDTV